MCDRQAAEKKRKGFHNFFEKKVDVVFCSNCITTIFGPSAFFGLDTLSHDQSISYIMVARCLKIHPKVSFEVLKNPTKQAIGKDFILAEMLTVIIFFLVTLFDR